MYTLKNNTTVVIKVADKGSVVVFRDVEDYIKEANKQFGDKEVYKEVPNNPSPLISAIFAVLNKIKLRGDVLKDTIDYFKVENPKFARFCLLPKIHKHLFNIPSRPVVSNCGYYTENISSFLDYHLQPITRAVKTYIKDTNDFLKKVRDLGNLLENAILCTVDVVGLYPNIPHGEGLAALRKFLDERDKKDVTTDNHVELAEVVLNNKNIFEFNERIYKQKCSTAIGTKFAPPYSIIFMANLEEKLLDHIDRKPYVW